MPARPASCSARAAGCARPACRAGPRRRRGWTPGTCAPARQGRRERVRWSGGSGVVRSWFDFHWGVGWNELEQFGDVGAAHADAADRSRLAHLGRVVRAVNVNVAAHGVDLAEPVEARLAARQPEDAREDPIASRVARLQGGRPDFAGRTAAHEHRAQRLARTDLGAHDVPAARRAEAAVLLPQAVPGRGYRIDL